MRHMTVGPSYVDGIGLRYIDVGDASSMPLTDTGIALDQRTALRQFDDGKNKG